jgi:AcrR family transcriptional regulator
MATRMKASLDNKRTDSAPRRGRPPVRTEAETRHLIVAAATQEFLKNGFDVGMAQIAARAGVSKRTIYEIVPTKDDLFEAIFYEWRMPLDFNVDDGLYDGWPAEKVLEHMMHDIAFKIFRADGVAFYRLINAQADRFPDVARAYYAAGPEALNRLVANVLTTLQKRKLISIGDPFVTATMLVSMVIAEPFRASLMGARPLMRGTQLKAHVRTAVQLFLRGATSDEAGRI